MPAAETLHPAQPGLLAALEQAGVDAARVEEVADLIVLAATADGCAGPGSVVTVADRAGRVTEYELIARPAPEDERRRVTLASPTGRALLGARSGDYVRVTRPNGRLLRVKVLSIVPGSGPAAGI